MTLEAVARRRRSVDAIGVVFCLAQKVTGDTGVLGAAGSVFVEVEFKATHRFNEVVRTIAEQLLIAPKRAKQQRRTSFLKTRVSESRWYAWRARCRNRSRFPDPSTGNSWFPQ